MKIGLTGMIGSGKSTAADFFKKQNFYIINADEIGKTVVNRDKKLLRRLSEEFGCDIVTAKRNLRRKVLARKAFSSEALRLKLNTLVHPFLLRELHIQYEHHLKKKHNFVLDAALLLEWNLENLFDYVICIHASEKNRIKRMADRGYTKQQIINIQQRQLSYTEYRRRSDFVVTNNSTKTMLFQKLNKLMIDISSLPV